MLILKICCSEFINENRDKRELSVCRELGMDIVVMAKGEQSDKFKKDIVNGFEVRRFTTRPFKASNAVNRVLSLFTWAHYARSFKADIISGHDLIALFIAYMSNSFKPKSKKAKLVYDSHEFEIGRNQQRSSFTKWVITHLERFLIKRCAFSIMVNDSIADEVMRIHKLKQRPVVIRNTPPEWVRDDEACLRVRKAFCEALNVSEDAFLVMYHGKVLQNRGIEDMLKAVAIKNDIAAVILGDGSEDYVNHLKTIAEKLDIKNRVLFHKAVPINILKDYVGAADCGLITIPNACTSYYYMLPNKFFENIQSETPMIGSNFPEIRRLIEEYKIGLLCDPSNPDEIASQIEKMQTDIEFYRSCKTNLKIAKQQLSWENEKKALKEAYGYFL